MFTLVPSVFFDSARERDVLAEVARLRKEDIVKHIEILQYDAVLIYTEDEDSVVSKPEILLLLDKLPSCSEYNKILCSIKDDNLYLGIAQGKSLLLANSYKIQNFTTAEYFLFLAVKSLQINPEMSTVCWLSELDAEDEMSLYRYFKAVIKI